MTALEILAALDGWQKEVLDIWFPEEIEADLDLCELEGTTDGFHDQLLSELDCAGDERAQEALKAYVALLEKAVLARGVKPWRN